MKKPTRRPNPDSNLDYLKALEEDLSTDERNSLAHYLLGYLSTGISAKRWRHSVDSGILFTHKIRVRAEARAAEGEATCTQ